MTWEPKFFLEHVSVIHWRIIIELILIKNEQRNLGKVSEDSAWLGPKSGSGVSQVCVRPGASDLTSFVS